MSAESDDLTDERHLSLISTNDGDATDARQTSNLELSSCSTRTFSRHATCVRARIVFYIHEDSPAPRTGTTMVTPLGPENTALKGDRRADKLRTVSQSLNISNST